MKSGLVYMQEKSLKNINILEQKYDKSI
jgi:hypothetical protein